VPREHLTVVKTLRYKRLLLALFAATTIFGQSIGEDRDVSWKKLVPNILQDQKHIWTLPARLAEGDGRDWLASTVVVATTGGLVVADPHISGYFRSHESTFHDLNNAFSGGVTAAITAAPPVAMLAFGMLRHDQKMTKTSLLVAEAVADVQVIQVVFKGATGRLRPTDVPHGNLSDSWNDRSGFNRFQSSFPSGHELTAMAVATVISHRYKEHRWVPILSYGIAGAIGFTRVAQGAHFTSDVFMGAALGYTVARFSVLPNHE
jgi:membrane-associated phospholipid phosphatase